MLDRRRENLELMDLPNPNPAEIRLAILEIEKINRLLGGFNQTIHDLVPFIKEETLDGEGKSILIQDWGCGSGDLLRKLESWSKKRQYNLALIGYDKDPETLQYAKEQSQNYSLILECKDVLLNVESCVADIVCSCLFTHHFTDEAWIELIQAMYLTCRKAVIINDLHRHPIAYYAIAWLTKVFAKSYMVKYDAPLSVAKGFKRKELEKLLIKAGFENYQIKWHWAFRWSIIIYKLK